MSSLDLGPGITSSLTCVHTNCMQVKNVVRCSSEKNAAQDILQTTFYAALSTVIYCRLNTCTMYFLNHVLGSVTTKKGVPKFVCCGHV